MKIQDYYQRVRMEEAGLDGPDVWITRLPTKNGGVGGRVMQVPTRIAAKMLVEGIARRASKVEVQFTQEGEARIARRSLMEIPVEHIVPSDLREGE